MKMAIISDSHGNKSGINKLFEIGGFDYFFYLGDGLSDLGSYQYLDNVFVVSGNCDYLSSVENEKIFELDGIKFFITHGNNYGVKYSMSGIRDRAKELNVRVVCFGHTHRQLMEEREGILYLNPGSFKRVDGVSTGLILDIDKKSYSLSTIKVN